MSNHVRQIETSRLRVKLEVSGPDTGRPGALLHLWPDSLRCWDLLVSALHSAEIRTIVQSLRAYCATRFLNPDTPRSGKGVAFAWDALELADAISIDRFTVVGHDWDARVVFAMSILAPERLTVAVANLLGWKTPADLLPLSPEQGRAFWYQWYFATRYGENAFLDAPPGWYSEEQWKIASAAWTNPDWQDVVRISIAADGSPTSQTWPTMLIKKNCTSCDNDFGADAHHLWRGHYLLASRDLRKQRPVFSGRIQSRCAARYRSLPAVRASLCSC